MCPDFKNLVYNVDERVSVIECASNSENFDDVFCFCSYNNFFFHSRKNYDSVKFIRNMRRCLFTQYVKIRISSMFLRAKIISTFLSNNFHSCVRFRIIISLSRSVLLYKTFCRSTRTLSGVRSHSKKSCIGAQIAPTRSQFSKPMLKTN